MMSEGDDRSKSKMEGVDDDEVAETDPDGRYYRYKEVVGKGRFKQVYKAFDTQIGIDVAWSKILADQNHLTEEQLDRVVDDMKTGLDLEHPNIIKCFKCWEDDDSDCINLITELFTSGNLRQYRNLHKHLDLKAVKRMARQILKGLNYLHQKQPPVTHGDLRCDKIYVNGHSGEIKIGDLGLATLLPFRWENQSEHFDRLSSSTDIFAFGLCMLELITLKQLDPQHCLDHQVLVEDVQDAEARAFISKCLGLTNRPTAEELLEDPFLSIKKPEAKGPGAGGSTGGGPGGADPDSLNASLGSGVGLSALGAGGVAGVLAAADHEHNHGGLHGHGGAGGRSEKRRTDDAGDDPTSSGEAPIAVGKLRGEDYLFEFHGKVKDGKLHFRLTMTGATEVPGEETLKRTIDFIFDPEVDTADNLAAEIADEFMLSPTDTEICAAALKEWLAKELPGMSESGK